MTETATLLYRSLEGVRRFLWWVAGGYGECLARPDMPKWERKTYSLIGGFVILSSVAAGIGWLSEAHRVHASGEAFFGLFGAGFCFLFEQLVIQGIRPDFSRWTKVAAFLWRFSLAVFDAVVLVVPGLVGALHPYINQAIATAERDNIASNRETTDSEFSISTLTNNLGSLNTQIAQAVVTETQYPSDVQQKLADSAKCNADLRSVRATLSPQIASDEQERRQLRAQQAYANVEVIASESRINVLDRDITKLRSQLSVKGKICGELTTAATNAVAAHQAPIKIEIQRLTAQQTAQESHLTSTRGAADSAAEKVEIEIKKSDLPGVVTDLFGLFELLKRNWIALVISGFVYVAAVIMFVTPALLKLSARKTDPLPKAAEAQRADFTAARENEINLARARAVGMRLFCEADAPALYAAGMRENVRSDLAKVAIREEGDRIENACSELARGFERVAELAAREDYREAVGDLSPLHQALREMMLRVNLRSRAPFREAAE